MDDEEVKQETVAAEPVAEAPKKPKRVRKKAAPKKTEAAPKKKAEATPKKGAAAAPKKAASKGNGLLEQIVGARQGSAKARVVQYLLDHPKKQVTMNQLGNVAYPGKKDHSGLSMVLKGINETLKAKKIKHTLKGEGEKGDKTIGIYPV